jgi:phenolic acid decarboxylase
MAVFRKIGVLYILICLNLVKITTKYWFRIGIVGGRWVKCENTESEGFNLTLGVKWFTWAFVG